MTSCALLQKRNYKFSAAVGRYGAVSIPVIAVLNTGAEPVLICEGGFDPACHSNIRSVQSPRLVDEFERLMESNGLVHFTARIREFCEGCHFS